MQNDTQAAPQVHATGDNALAHGGLDDQRQLSRAPVAGGGWWVAAGVSERCELDCTAERCVLPVSERGRWWPDCPHADCPEWKLTAVSVERTTTEAARLARERAYAAGRGGGDA